MEGETANSTVPAAMPFAPAHPVENRWNFRTPSPPPKGCIEPITPIHTPSVPYTHNLPGSESPKRRRLNKSVTETTTSQSLPQVPYNGTLPFHSFYAPQGSELRARNDTAPVNPLELLADLALSTALSPAQRSSKPPGGLESAAAIHSYTRAERSSFPSSYASMPSQPADASAFSPLSLAKDKIAAASHLYGSTRVSQHPAYPSSILTMPSNPITFVPSSITQPPPKNPPKSRSRAKPEGKGKDRRRSNRLGPNLEEGSQSPKKAEAVNTANATERAKADLVVGVRRLSGTAEDDVDPSPRISPAAIAASQEPPSSSAHGEDVSAAQESPELGHKGIDAAANTGSPPPTLPTEIQSETPAVLTSQLVEVSRQTEAASPITDPIVRPAVQSSVIENTSLHTIPTPPSSELPLSAPEIIDEKVPIEIAAPGQVSPAISDDTVVLGKQPISPPRDITMPDADIEEPEEQEVHVETNGHLPEATISTAGGTDEAASLQKDGPVPVHISSAEPIETQELKEKAPDERQHDISTTADIPQTSVSEEANASGPDKMDIDEPVSQATETEVCAICKSSLSPSQKVDNEMAAAQGSINTAWIECDGCKKWHHNFCAGLEDKQVELIDKYHCPSCEPVKGPTTLRRKSARMRASIDYGALNEGSSIPIKSDDNLHHYVPLLVENQFEFEVDIFPRVTPDKLAHATYLKHDGWKLPTIITAESNPRPPNSSIGDFIPGADPDAPLPTIAPDSIGMSIPSDLTVRKVADLIGHDYPLEVIDVRSQNQDKKWVIGKWADYYESTKKDAVRNVISLEVSKTPLGEMLRRPQVVREMDLSDWAWPKDGAGPTSVQLYCLMSVKNAFTDFHIDFGGSSVFYHIISGAKTFLFIEPTDENLKAYEDWCNHPNQNYEWLAKGRACYRIDLSAGDTMLIPSGWIHAVFTPADSLVIGGNFLTRQSVGMQMRVHEIETRTKVPRKFRYPNFAKLHWFVAQKYLVEDPVPPEVAARILLGAPAHKRVPLEPLPGKEPMFLLELEGLLQLCNFLLRNSLIANGDVEVPKETRSAVTKAIPKGLTNHGYDLVKDLAVWTVWKRACGEKTPEWARPGRRRGLGFPGVVEKDTPLSDAEIRERASTDINSAGIRFRSYFEQNKSVQTKAQEATNVAATPAPPQNQSSPIAPSSSKSRSKRKRESKIDEDVFKEAISRVSMAGTFTRPKFTILGPLKTACDNCSKKKVRCVHKEEVQAKQKEVQEVYNRLLKEKQSNAGLAHVSEHELLDLPAPNAKRRASGVRSVKPDIHGADAVPVDDNAVIEDDTEMVDAVQKEVVHSEETEKGPTTATETTAPPMENTEASAADRVSTANKVDAEEKNLFTPAGIVAKNGRKKACNACRAVRRRCLHAPDGSGLVVDEASLQRAGVNTQPVVRKSRQEAASAIKASSAPPPSTRSTERSPEALADGHEGESSSSATEKEASTAAATMPLVPESAEVIPEATTKEGVKEEVSEDSSITAIARAEDDDDNESVCSKLTSVNSSDFSENEAEDKPTQGLMVTLRFPSKKHVTSATSPPALRPQANPTSKSPPTAAPSNFSSARFSPPRRASRPKMSPPAKLLVSTASSVKRKHGSPTSPATNASSPPLTGKRPRRSSSSKVDDSLYHPHHHATQPGPAALLEGSAIFEESKIHEFGLRRRRSTGR